MLGFGPLPPVFTPALVRVLSITAVVHSGMYLANSILPLHVVALGGTKTQVGLLFSVATVISMFLRPLVGGWNDRFGFRAIAVPGAAILTLTLLTLLVIEAPAAVVALMLGLGLGNGLVTTSAGVLASRATAPAQRAEALSIYYVATASALAVGPPIGFALYRAGGITVGLLVAAALTAAALPLAWSLRDRAAQPIPGARPGLRLYSRHAVPIAITMILTNIGYSSVYAFLPLYAIASGAGGGVGWFYFLYSVWLIGCRIVFRRLADRLGRPTVVTVAIGAIALAYFALAIPPSPLSLGISALLLGTGSALLYPTLVALLVDRTPEPERGLAIGTLSASWDVGVVIGSVAIGLIVERTAYAAGFAVAGATGMLGLAAFLAFERARSRVVPRPSPGVSF